MMTLIPLAVAVVVTLYLLGGPEEALRALERVGYDLVQMAGIWFRR